MKKFILGMKSGLLFSIDVTGTADEKLNASDFLSKYLSTSKDTNDWYADINGKIVLLQQIESIETIEVEAKEIKEV